MIKDYGGLISMCSTKNKRGLVREGSSGFPYLLILIQIWPGNWKTQLKRMTQKFDEDNGKSLGKGNLRYRKACCFSRNEFWKYIRCLVSAPIFGIGCQGFVRKKRI